MTPRCGAVCAAVLVAWPWFLDCASAQETAGPPEGTIAQALNPLGDVPLATVSPFLDRPLFAASRRKAVVPQAAVAMPAPPPPAEAPPSTNYRLLGTIATATGVSAVIQDADGGRTRTVGRGEAVDRWRIAEIEASRVRLEENGRSVWLEIFGPTVPAAGPAGSGRSSVPNPVVIPAEAVSVGTAPPATTGGAVPPGTVAGTAAAEAARRPTYSLTFGTVEPKAAD